jgi:hypothetical protein
MKPFSESGYKLKISKNVDKGFIFRHYEKALSNILGFGEGLFSKPVSKSGFSNKSGGLAKAPWFISFCGRVSIE